MKRLNMSLNTPSYRHTHCRSAHLPRVPQPRLQPSQRSPWSLTNQDPALATKPRFPAIRWPRSRQGDRRSLDRLRHAFVSYPSKPPITSNCSNLNWTAANGGEPGKLEPLARREDCRIDIINGFSHWKRSSNSENIWSDKVSHILVSAIPMRTILDRREES